MRLIVAALLVVGCTEHETTIVEAESPPLELSGTYSVTWPDASRGAVSVGEATVWAPYPCAVTDSIGGDSLYDPITGEWHAEAKTIEGSVKLVVDGVWSGERCVGECAVLVLGVECMVGRVEVGR